MKTIFKTNRQEFEMKAFLGEGLSSRVYLCSRKFFDFQENQLVAVKILKSETLVPSLVQNMEKLLQLRSKHCSVIYSLEQISEGFGLCMEYIDGVSLNDFIQSRLLSPKIKQEILAQCQQALLDLHAYELFHGDLHPNNILIDKNGRVVLIDFGFINAKIDNLVGQPKFMAPERFLCVKPSIKSDLFSLGLIGLALEQSYISANAYQAESSSCSAAFYSEAELNYLEQYSINLKKARLRHCFLNPVPEERRFNFNLKSNFESKLELAHLVQNVLNNKRHSHKIKTLSKSIGEDAYLVKDADTSIYIDKNQNQGLRSKLIVSYKIFCLSMLLFTFLLKDTSARMVRLQLRSLRAREFYLDNIRLGYAPLDISVPEGIHLVQANTEPNTREYVLLNLNAQSSLILGDQDFKSLPR